MVVYGVYRRVYLNRMIKKYETILVVRPRVNHKDSEIIRNITKLLHIGKLSTFDNETNYGKIHCDSALINMETGKLLLEEDMSILLNYLQTNECQIDYKLSKVLKNCKSTKDLIFKVNI